ncbi:DEAD/DEAH box helicase [Segatella paludivivens]|uniref:DEAD/DEAH box helicase n=1 Tax=Segatella paludivivens TaxID=185294 RepID=UPI00277D0FB3|nr:AAA domain-containing protein [Segatella paludivivens]
MYHFATKLQRLTFAQRQPRKDESIQLSHSYNPSYDEIILKAKQALDYFLLVGPPGTGKTSMALQYMVRESISSDQSILLMSYTNRAVDEICGMLSDNDIDYIRIGNEFTCDTKYRQHLLSQIIENCPKLNVIRQKILDCKVIVGTTSTIQGKSYLFNLKHFSTVIVDEASQILEPNIIGLLAQADSKFVLIGDYKQLPAVVQQDSAISSVNDVSLNNICLDNCRNSLFERLIHIENINNRNEFTGVLRRQGRMHPDIAEFPNKMFYYKENLQPVPLEHQTKKQLEYSLESIDYLDNALKARRMVFIPSRFCKEPNISDKVNSEEAKIVTDILRRIYRFYGVKFNADKTVGVIVPYRNQISMIRKEIEKLGIPELGDISIDTVERYQGSQRDVIIYSFTIQNRYQLDFLTSNCFEEDDHIIDRKLNVAITRARKQMILTGNAEILNNDIIFKSLIEHIKSKGGYIEYE